MNTPNVDEGRLERRVRRVGRDKVLGIHGFCSFYPFGAIRGVPLLRLTALELLENRPEKFILCCDDLSFEAEDTSYKRLKAALEGSLSGLAGNGLVYATSNRRHFLPEYQGEKQEAKYYTGADLQC